MARAVIERADVLGFACHSKACAPPPVGDGGSDPTKAGSAQSRAMRSAVKQNNLAMARDAAEGITTTMQSVAKAAGARMVGLKYRYKSVDKIAEKIGRKVSEKGIEPEVAEKGITDALRFTMMVGTEDYVGKVDTVKRELEAAGMKVIEESNKWVDGTPYAGHHLLVRSPLGQVFELQFHTKRSFEVKEGALHKLYEVERMLPKPSSAEYKSMAPEEQRAIDKQRNDLTEQMWQAAESIPVPPTVERLPSSEEYRPPTNVRVGPNAARMPRRVTPKRRG